MTTRLDLTGEAGRRDGGNIYTEIAQTFLFFKNVLSKTL